MDLREYQEFAKKGVKKGYNLEVFGLGLGGETGEVLEIIKKSRRDEVPIELEHFMEELGDVLWYVANLCSCMNISLEAVLNYNVNKLTERYALEEKVKYLNIPCIAVTSGPHIKLLVEDTRQFIKFISKQEYQKLKEEQNNEQTEDLPW